MDKNNQKRLARELQNFHIKKEIRIMEVCGTHTREFFRTGVKDIFPKGLHLTNGPGCPVCVTPNEYIDKAIEIGKKYKTIIATFGDIIHVPSSYSSLAREKANGMDIEIVYSPLDALEIVQKYSDREVMLLSIGFETTAPTEAMAVIEAKKKNLKNFSILPGNKLTVPAVKILLDTKDINIDGFILPGHVSTIIGAGAWRFIADEYKKACVVAGFEDHDLIKGTLLLLDLIKREKNNLINEYRRVVREEGNQKAQAIMYDVFRKIDSNWRGIGVIPESGLAINEAYSDFDSEKKFPVTPPEPREVAGCRCGELLRGIISPLECSFFGGPCTPEHPVGACMVSSEGACSAYYLYGRKY